MGPQTSVKRKSEMMEDVRAADQATTPTNSGPAKKKMRITQLQKQTLIDNLQLEGISQLREEVFFKS